MTTDDEEQARYEEWRRVMALSPAEREAEYEKLKAAHPEIDWAKMERRG